MKFISTLLFASLAIFSANANHLPTTDFGPGCLNFQDDGSWNQVPDFVTNDPFLVAPESPFRFSSDTRFPDQAVRVGATGELSASDYDWTLGIFDTKAQNGGAIYEAWYKSNDHGTFATTWHATSANGNKHNTFQIVISEAIGGDMGEGNNVCFCYGDMQWGPGNVHVASSNSSDHTHVDFSGGTYQNAAADNSLDHKTCCFHADKLKQLGSSADFASLCHSRGTEAGSNGDPHFKTWHNQHFEYHGQCDLVLTKDPDFADGLGIDVHIRTKLVRHWSYIKNAVIRIGNDILEIEGSSVEFDSKPHYWINYESQGELSQFAGFPVKMFSQQGTAVTKNRIEIDLSSVYPGQKIVLSTYKEFVKVSFENANEESFGTSVGMLGDFNTGQTLARDGVTVLDDFTDLGHEWQVLPSDKHLFREASAPQFPETCIDPEDPRGDRRRRLDGSSIGEEEAETACAGIKDELDRKDCVYDILATQDMDMAGAY
ncbi:unnamed protein product [Cylindrotheca closterium]|uniref:VWFD domain-containing protein n=1 Tax=Cylindrotheca closterium TaxID=2856 RepID=A0AAD2CEI0_9STRA|nr:unnamed protein product [Cylindrotheca closterium]